MLHQREAAQLRPEMAADAVRQRRHDCLALRCQPARLSPGQPEWLTGRLWKRELQALANELGIEIKVHHLPPGTSKWNKIEHRLFSFITM
jgi:hypothetical protein